MNLHLVRHAHAVAAEEDPARPLSARGRKQVQALAKVLARGDSFAPEEFWHSPLARSRETATLLARGLELRARLVEVPGLEPEDDPDIMVRRLKGRSEPLALVGHEPHLSALATRLVGGPAGWPIFALRKGGIISLEGAGAHWQVRWQLAPELLG